MHLHHLYEPECKLLERDHISDYDIGSYNLLEGGLKGTITEVFKGDTRIFDYGPYILKSTEQLHKKPGGPHVYAI